MRKMIFAILMIPALALAGGPRISNSSDPRVPSIQARVNILETNATVTGALVSGNGAGLTNIPASGITEADPLWATWTNGTAIKLGRNTASTSSGSVALGQGAIADLGGIAAGYGTTASGLCNVAIGYGVVIPDSYSYTVSIGAKSGSCIVSNNGWLHFRGLALVDPIGSYYGPTVTVNQVNSSGLALNGTNVAVQEFANVFASNDVLVALGTNTIGSTNRLTIASVVTTYATGTTVAAAAITSGTVTVSSKLGVGVTDPAAYLEVHPANDDTNAFRVYRGKDGGYQLDYLNIDVVAGGGNDVRFRASKSADLGGNNLGMAFNIVGTDTVYFAANGNVGIGTNVPASKLNVAGTYVDPLSTAHGILEVNSSTLATNDKGASISIGGAYTGTTPTQYGVILGAKESVTDGDYAGYLMFATRPSGNTSLERLRITSTGNVGIGTNVPGAKLHVAGDMLATNVQCGSITQSTTTAINYFTANTGFRTATPLACIDICPPLGVDTYGAHALRFTAGNNSGYGWCWNLETSANGDSFYMRITNSVTNCVMSFERATGYVGLGVQDPGHLLHLSGGAYCDGTGDWIAGSDITYKRAITSLPCAKYGLKEILQLVPVEYIHKEDPKNRVQLGLIANDVVKVIPEVVDGQPGSYGIAYNRLIPVIINAIREQDVAIRNLTARIAALEKVAAPELVKPVDQQVTEPLFKSDNGIAKVRRLRVPNSWVLKSKG